jgi:hypothetical protein
LGNDINVEKSKLAQLASKLAGVAPSSEAQQLSSLLVSRDAHIYALGAIKVEYKEVLD